MLSREVAAEIVNLESAAASRLNTIRIARCPWADTQGHSLSSLRDS